LLRTRLLTAAIAIPGLWWIVEFVPPWRPPWGAALFVGFIMAVTAAGLHEYFAMALPEHPFERVLGIMWGIVVAAGVASRRPEFWGAALALGLIGGLGLTLVRSADLGGAVQRLGLALLGVLYLGFFTPHIVLLRAGAWGWQWVLLTVFGAMGSDSGGYFAGRVFGRHKLAPAISPSKTYEGAIGAVAGAMLVAWLSHVLFFPVLGAWEAASIGAVISLLGQLGDLSESALKRAFGAKDSGWIIPGHGGILDRLDSILFPVVFTYYYAAFPRA
jgi:phosphatidate cytidylyltransferase